MPSHIPPMRTSLDQVATQHEVAGIVVSDIDGLLIASSSDLPDAISLAATTPFVNAGTPIASNTPVPTMARVVSLGDTDVLVAAVGEPGRCRAALQEAARWIQQALAA